MPWQGSQAYLVWSADHGADFKYLIDLRGTGEERPEGVDLGHDGAHSPDVDVAAVGGGAKQHLRRSVPAGGRVW